MSTFTWMWVKAAGCTFECQNSWALTMEASVLQLLVPHSKPPWKVIRSLVPIPWFYLIYFLPVKNCHLWAYMLFILTKWHQFKENKNRSSNSELQKVHSEESGLSRNKGKENNLHFLEPQVVKTIHSQFLHCP